MLIRSRNRRPRPIQNPIASRARSVAVPLVAPDGKSVYVTGVSSVVTLRSNATSGKLRWIQELADPSAGGSTRGLANASGVVVDPSGANVYAAGSHDDDVDAFKRNLSSGKLTWKQELLDVPQGDSPGLKQVHGLDASADGTSVYATGSSADSVVTFRRDRTTGLLTWMEEDVDPSSGGSTEGLDGATSMASSPDGTSVYATGHFDRDHDQRPRRLRRDANLGALSA